LNILSRRASPYRERGAAPKKGAEYSTEAPSRAAKAARLTR